MEGTIRQHSPHGSQSGTDSDQHDGAPVSSGLVQLSRSTALAHRSRSSVARRVSTDDISRARRNSLADKDASITQLTARFEKLATSRAHETAAHGELDSAQQEWQRLREAFRKSRIQYENAIDPFGPPLETTSTDQNIRKLREFCINDRSVLEAHSAKVRAIQRNLHLAQIARNRSELNFMQSARKWVGNPGLHPPFDITTSPPSTHAPHPDENPTPALSIKDTELARRYRSKVTEARSLGERLADLNFEYWNEVARRELRQDHDEKLSVTDEEFEEMHSRDKEVVSQELARVIEEAKKIRSESLSAITSANRGEWELLDLKPAVSENLGVGPHRGYEESLQAALEKVPQEAFVNAEAIRGDTSEYASEGLDSARDSERITTWMDDVPLGQSNDSTLEP
jgi:hypothetical protein